MSRNCFVFFLGGCKVFCIGLVVVSALACEKNAPQRIVFFGPQKVGTLFLKTVQENKNLEFRRVLNLKKKDSSTLVLSFDNDKKLKKGHYLRQIAKKVQRSISFSITELGDQKNIVIQDELFKSKGAVVLKSALLKKTVPASTRILPLGYLSEIHRLEEFKKIKNPVLFFEVSLAHFFWGSLVQNSKDAQIWHALDDKKQIVATFNADELLGPGFYAEVSTQKAANFIKKNSFFFNEVQPVKIAWPSSAAAATLFFAGLKASDFPCLQGRTLRERATGIFIRASKAWVDCTQGLSLPRDKKYKEPTLFLQSDASEVVAFASENTQSQKHALLDALSLAEAIHQHLILDDDAGPPSALNTLQNWRGDCDNATALLVAALRARGHAARPIVGYRRLGEFYGAHAWAEVYTEKGWVGVDALLPGVGTFSTHIPLFIGFGHSLNMGRVLLNGKALHAVF